MKKLLSLVLCLMFVCAALPAMAYTAGDYTASAQGMNGPVEVTVSFSDSAITAITVGAHSETPGICDAAIERLPAAIVDGQTLAVDTVSGATFTSNAILTAVEDAAVQAGADVAALKSASGEAAAVAEDEVLTYDVVVVGGGAAGIGAAANAKDAGASVLLLEKQARMGGNTMISGGLIYATGTSFQKRHRKRSLCFLVAIHPK